VYQYGELIAAQNGDKLVLQLHTNAGRVKCSEYQGGWWSRYFCVGVVGIIHTRSGKVPSKNQRLGGAKDVDIWTHLSLYSDSSVSISFPNRRYCSVQKSAVILASSTTAYRDGVCQCSLKK